MLFFSYGLTFRPIILRRTAQVFVGGTEHQLDTVQLVYLRSARIIVNGHNISLRVIRPDMLDNALSDDVIRQAAKRLDADNVHDAAVDQIHHLAGQDRPLPRQLPDRNER